MPDKPKEEQKGTEPTLRKGSRGDWVTILQQKLILRGYNCGSKGADGIYGDATVKAVKAFQKDNGLTQDGVAGPKTWAALNQAPAETYYTVTIKNKTKAQAEEIISKYGGTMTAE